MLFSLLFMYAVKNLGECTTHPYFYKMVAIFPRYHILKGWHLHEQEYELSHIESTLRANIGSDSAST